MYPQTLYPKTKQVLEKLKNSEIISGFYLAGGTALALQLGHRKSIDLDFFTGKFPERDLLINSLKIFNPVLLQEARGTIDLSIEGVKVSFLEYQYPLMEDLTEFEGVKMSGILDIACMKLSAVSSRGAKKDFVDLYYLLQKYSLEEIFTAFRKKYQGVEYSKMHILKSLTYFADAEAEPTPDLIRETEWNKIKQDIELHVKNYLNIS